MKKLVYLLLFVGLSGFQPGVAQRSDAPRLSFRPDTLAAVRVGSQWLPNAWAGGLNSAQYSRLRLDADTLADLVVFDRAGGKLSTFLAQKQGTGYAWRHAPQYEAQFPSDLSDWVLLVDYDGDGRRDLFTRAALGVRVFRNATTGTGPLKWEKVADPVYSIGNSGTINLYVSPTDLPAITDLDGDGDLDLLAFDLSGNFVEFHRNESVETTGKRGLVFRKIDFCWGNFWKEHCKDFRFDIDCTTGRFLNGRRAVESPAASEAREAATLHAGNSLLVTDLTGDGRKDALFGHVTCQNVAFLPNTGTPQRALFETVNYEFPTNQPILFQVFPALFQEDLDFDGKPDLIAVPNTTSNEGDLIDYRTSNWFYQNVSTGPVASFALRQKDFLQAGMVDLGENAAPLLLDLDGDSDLDLLVGYGGVRGERGYRGGLALYRNVGSKTAPQFEWQTDDFLGLAQKFLMTDVKPFVADLNGDRLPDLGYVANTLKGVEMRYLPNRGTAGGAFVLSADAATLLTNPANLSAGDSPVFYDVDGDGKTDLLVGKQYQNIEYYRNTGGESAVFSLITEEFGGTKTVFSERGLTLLVADPDANGKADLLALNSAGALRVFRQFTLGQSQTLTADSLIFEDGLNPVSIRRQPGSYAAAVGDLNADGRPDLLLGTVAGGLRLLRGTTDLTVTGLEPAAREIQLFPNPTERFVSVTAPTDAQAEVFTLAGQTVLTRPLKGGQEQVLDLGGLAPGLYFVRILGLPGGPLVRKVVLGQ